jgi:hypothetical protein
MKQIQYTSLIYFIVLMLCLIASFGCGREDVRFNAHCYDVNGTPYASVPGRWCNK